MFTNEQIAAIKEKGNIIVSAGAGAGKTLVLSERVLHFIQHENYKIEDFLILTFTRLAAQEMKERIRSKLLKANLEDANNIDNADISTFDSFTNSLVKKYHTHLGLDQTFTLIDSNVIEVLKRKFLRKEFDRLYNEENQTFFNLLHLTCKKNDNPIFTLILNVMKKANNQLDKYDFYDSFINKYYSKEIFEEIFSNITDELLVKKEDILSILEVLPNCIDKKGVSFVEKYTIAFDELINSCDYDSIVYSCKNFKAPILSQNFKDQLDQDEIDEYKKLKEKNDKLISSIKSLPSKEEGINNILEGKDFAALLIDISKRIDLKVDAYKHDYQVFEFIDINRFAIKLVKEFEDIRNEISAKYKMIMIDEYQDTNDIQEEFISYIQKDNVYCVGDIKQSIYAFRNAKCDIFQNKYQTYKNDKTKGQAIDLNANFRSREEVLEDINLIFKNLMTLDVGGADYQKEHIIQFGNNKYSNSICKSQNNHLEIYLDEEDSNYSEMEIIAQDIVDKINNKYQVCDQNDENLKLRACKFSDFAIIVDRCKRFEDYAKILQKYKIPVYIEQDVDLKENSIVLLLKEILLFTLYLKENREIDKAFKHAFVSIARSFIYSYSDRDIYLIVTNDLILKDPITISIKKTIMDNQGISDYLLINKVIENMKLYLSIIRLGNIYENSSYLDSFLDTFKQMDVIDFNIEDFIAYLDSINEFNLKFNVSSNASNSNAVTIINIHKSKGLEYPITYFGGLKEKFVRFDVKGTLGLSKEYGFYFNDIASIAKRAYVNKYDEELVSEKLRLFYVALTRCREKMIFITSSLEDPKKYRVNQSLSFNHFLSSNAHLFTTEKKKSRKKVKLIFDSKNEEGVTFKILNIDFDFTYKNDEIVASKEINLDVKKELLDFGNKLHFALEVIDLKNPNYSLLNDPFLVRKVKSFISSNLLKNIKGARVFKEYEFNDEENNTKGIIDLFLLYKDKIVLIDYKTKNINDPFYEKQLLTYAKFLQNKYNLKIEAYLYSLVLEEYRKVEVS